MIRSSVWGKTVTLNMTAVPTGNYQVWLYVWEDNFAQIYSVSIEGSVVLSNYNSGTAGVWRKLGPYPVTITDGAINVSSSGGDAAFSGIEVWTGTSAATAITSAVARMATPEEETPQDNAVLEANPNPFSAKLNVRFTARQSANARVELFDLQGRSIHVVYSGQMSAGETKETELETSELPDGIYVLQFINGKHVARLKLMGIQ
jgi:chitinase